MRGNHAKCVTLETDYNFQDLGYGGCFIFLQNPSASPALNDYLSLKLDCENSKKKLSSGSVALNL